MKWLQHTHAGQQIALETKRKATYRFVVLLLTVPDTATKHKGVTVSDEMCRELK